MSQGRREALQKALQMEEDGKAYYEKARDKASNAMAKSVFDHLIKAEENHMKKIQQLYRSLEETGTWPAALITKDTARSASSIFAEALENIHERVKGSTDDIDALRMAAQIEEKGRKYYQNQADATDDPFEKKFYYLLVQEEGEHFISILDTIQYLEDPQGYFHQLERGTISF